MYKYTKWSFSGWKHVAINHRPRETQLGNEFPSLTLNEAQPSIYY